MIIMIVISPEGWAWPKEEEVKFGENNLDHILETNNPKFSKMYPGGGLQSTSPV